MQVSEIMTPNPITVTSDTPVGKIREIFSRMRIWSVYVTDNGKLVGIFTKSDLRNRMYRKPISTPVYAVMSRDVKWVKPDTDIKAAEEYLSRFHINGLAIVKDGALCGILTRYDIKTRYHGQSHDQAIKEEGIKINESIDNNTKTGELMPSGETDGTQVGLTERGGIRDKLTGRDDMIFIRTRYQSLLDNNYFKASRIIEYLKQVSDDAKEKQKLAEGLKENIDAHMKERDRAHTNLQNLLNKEEKYEDKMLGKTLKGMKAGGRVTVKQKMKDVDIDTLQYGSVEQYKRLYPHYGAEIFEKITEVNKKEKEIREAQEAYNKEVSNYNYQLEIADKNIIAVKDAFKLYEKAKKEGDAELKACLYYNSIFYKKFISLKDKTLLNLDTTKHDLEGLEHQLGIIEKTFSAYTNEPLKPMKY